MSPDTRRDADDLLTSFNAWAKETARRRVEIAAFSIVAILIPARIIGALVLRGRPESAPGAFWMPVQIGIALAAGLVMRFSGVARRHPIPMAIFMFSAMSAAVAAHLSKLGGFDGPFFYAVYLIAAPVVMIPASLRARIALTLAPTLTFAVTFLLGHPSYLAYRMIHIPLTSLVAECVLGVSFGHSVYGVLRERHDLAREVERLAADKARSEERRALARVLHDDLAQINPAARMEVTAMERKAALGQLGATELGYLKELLESFERSSRRVVLNLRETSAEPLLAGIERMCQLAERTGSVRVVRELAACELAREEQEAIFRVLQESITNALRHGKARLIEVKIASDGGTVVASVRDDGEGFDTRTTSRGFGLLGIEERAAAVGGSIELESSPRGTNVTMRLPQRGRRHA